MSITRSQSMTHEADEFMQRKATDAPERPRHGQPKAGACLPRSRRRLAGGPMAQASCAGDSAGESTVAALAAGPCSAVNAADTLARMRSRMAANQGGSVQTAACADSTERFRVRCRGAAAVVADLRAWCTAASYPAGNSMPGSGTVASANGTLVAGWRPSSSRCRALARDPRGLPKHGIAKYLALTHA